MIFRDTVTDTVTVAENRQPSKQNPGLFSQARAVFMVAGAGFEPATFGL
jgi:hypothetical protein